jgi:hypothetical protein
MRRTKNKTAAAWLAFVGGPLGLHRFYLHGLADWLGWLLPLPTLAGLYGIARVQQFGLDDPLSWVLIPLLGFNIAACALTAIVYGLKTREEWNGRFNPALAPDDAAGATNWFTIGAIVLSLMIGTGCLMASIAYSFQRYFENQVAEGRRISE